MSRNICVIEGCESYVSGHGWCVKHYTRWRMHGDPLTRLKLRGAPLEERFLDKVNKDGPIPEEISLGACWQWIAGTNANDYGTMRGAHGSAMLSHRVAYELYVGPIPDGLELDHICVNASCVNPAHLEPVTHKVNLQRCHERKKLSRSLR